MILIVGKDNCPWCEAPLVAASSGGLSAEVVCASCKKALWWLEWYASTREAAAAEGPGAYPGVWKGITDELPVDRIVEGNKTTTDPKYSFEAEDLSSDHIRADRLAVVEMCREAIREKFSKMAYEKWFPAQHVDDALDSVKEKLK